MRIAAAIAIAFAVALCAMHQQATISRLRRERAELAAEVEVSHAEVIRLRGEADAWINEQHGCAEDNLFLSSLVWRYGDAANECIDTLEQCAAALNSNHFEIDIDQQRSLLLARKEP